MKKLATLDSYPLVQQIKRVTLFGLGIIVLSLFLACSGGDDNTTDPVDPTPAISIADQTAIEGNTMLFAVSLDQATSHVVVYSFATTNITATAPGDYSVTSGVDTIAGGEISATILVTTVDDGEAEATETFSVSLTSTTGATVARSLAIGTITDNDPTGVSFATQVQPLLRTSCGKPGFCHGGTAPGGHFYIGTEANYTTVINATGDNTALLPSSLDGKVIQPGYRGISTLFTKIDTTSPQPFGSPMPGGGESPLNLDEQNIIGDWIDQGAQDN